MRTNIQPVAAALGLPHIGWHTLRHSFSAWAKAISMPAEDRKTLLRHQSVHMGEFYGHVEMERKRELQNNVVGYAKKHIEERGQNAVPTPRKTA